MSTQTFADLGLGEDLSATLERRGMKEPFDIQRACIPDALTGRDILGRAPTGSGKTLGFGLPLLARLGTGRKKYPRGLILSPTRELADQIYRELEPLAAAVDRTALAVYGGVGFGPQVTAISRGVDVIVACPGRLLDLMGQDILSLAEVDIVVVDEADRMADMGFLPDVKRILGATSKKRQTVLFSATLDREVQVLVDKFLTDAARHEVGEVEPDMTLMDHRFIRLEQTQRIRLAAELIADTGPTMVFTRTRHGADRLARQLKREGVKAGSIHGGRTQSQRKRALEVFTNGKIDALVATDVAARGIHVDGVACVIHYDPPEDEKTYIHRSGRTARAGATGVVYSFVLKSQLREAERVQNKIGLDVDFEPPPELPPIDPALKQDIITEPGRKRGRSKKQSGGSSKGQRKGGSRSGDGGRTKPSGKKSGGRGSAKKSTKRRGRGSDEQTERESYADEGRPSRKSKSRRSKSHESGKSESGWSKQRKAKARKSASRGANAEGDPQENRGGNAKGKPSSSGKPAKSKRSGKPRPKNKKTRRSSSTNSSDRSSASSRGGKSGSGRKGSGNGQGGPGRGRGKGSPARKGRAQSKRR